MKRCTHGDFDDLIMKRFPGRRRWNIREKAPPSKWEFGQWHKAEKGAWKSLQWVAAALPFPDIVSKCFLPSWHSFVSVDLSPDDSRFPTHEPTAEKNQKQTVIFNTIKTLSEGLSRVSEDLSRWTRLIFYLWSYKVEKKLWNSLKNSSISNTTLSGF